MASISRASPRQDISCGATARLKEASASAISRGADGERSGLKFGQRAPLKLAFDGVMSNQPSSRSRVCSAADAPSLRDALRWTGRSRCRARTDALLVEAKTDFGWRIDCAVLVNIELDGNTAEGVLTYAADGRRTLQGNACADNLDVTPYLSTIRRWQAMRAIGSHADQLDGLTISTLICGSPPRASQSERKAAHGVAANLRADNGRHWAIASLRL